MPITVIKTDGRREPFDRSKLFAKLQLACNKRPIPTAKIEEIVDRIEAKLMGMGEREISAKKDIGPLVMEELKALDHVAYIRFASVYRHFKDLNEFAEELRQLGTIPKPSE
jgi:transcriptional repressor NrdR